MEQISLKNEHINTLKVFVILDFIFCFCNLVQNDQRKLNILPNARISTLYT